MSQRDDLAEINAQLAELERGRFRPKEKRNAERREWLLQRAELLYASAWWFNSLMTFVAGIAPLGPTDNVISEHSVAWMYASAYITTGLMFAPLLALSAGFIRPPQGD